MVEGEKGEPNAIERLRQSMADIGHWSSLEAHEASITQAARIRAFIVSPEAVEEVARAIAAEQWPHSSAEEIERWAAAYSHAPKYQRLAQAVLQLLALKGMGKA